MTTEVRTPEQGGEALTTEPRAPRTVPGHADLSAPAFTPETDPRDIILAPVISEKSYGLMEDNVYTFLVHPESNKTEIKIAIEKIFGVNVASVNTANRQGKRKRTRTGYGQRKSTKRAIVSLTADSKPIEIFGGSVS